MAEVQAKGFDSPDETRPFEEKGHVDIINMRGGEVGRGTFEPGWQWSKHVKPIAGTDSCQFHHVGYVESGRMKVVMDDGNEVEIAQGDVVDIPPGHDAWVVGDEPCVLIDLGGEKGYAKPQS